MIPTKASAAPIRVLAEPSTAVGWRGVRQTRLSVSNGHDIVADTMLRPDELEPYLAHLRRLPFVGDANAEVSRVAQVDGGVDAVVRLKTPRGMRRLHAEIKRTHLSYELAGHVASQMRNSRWKPSILMTPYVPPRLGQFLEERGINYVDRVGNCFLSLGPDFLARVEGRRRPPRDLPRATLRAPSYQVLFALLARPELANAPVRRLAENAGVGKTAAAEMVQRLESEGYLGRTRSGRQLLERERLLERWLTGYADALRPSLSLGRFRTLETNPAEVEATLEKALGHAEPWAWGGGAAAFRLTGHFRGEDSVLWISEPTSELLRRLKVRPAKDGPLTILRPKGTLMLEGAKPYTAHPLLVYAELLSRPSERAAEAAEEIRAKYLKYLETAK